MVLWALDMTNIIFIKIMMNTTSIKIRESISKKKSRFYGHFLYPCEQPPVARMVEVGAFIYCHNRVFSENISVFDIRNL